MPHLVVLQPLLLNPHLRTTTSFLFFCLGGGGVGYTDKRAIAGHSGIEHHLQRSAPLYLHAANRSVLL